MKTLIVPIFALTLALPLTSYADSQKYTDLPDDVVQKIMDTARPHLKDAKISDTEFVGEETPQQLADPLLTEAEGESALTRGIISEMAKFCGLDWENKSFHPYMQQQRENGKTPKQMAYFGVLHGIGMGLAEKTVAEKKAACSEKAKNHIATFLY